MTLEPVLPEPGPPRSAAASGGSAQGRLSTRQCQCPPPRHPHPGAHKARPRRDTAWGGSCGQGPPSVWPVGAPACPVRCSHPPQSSGAWVPQHVQTGRPTEVRDRAPRAPAHLLQLPRGPQCLQVPQEHAHVPAWQGQTGPRRAVWPAGWATPTDARAQQRLRAVPRPPGASPARAPQSRPRARPAVAAQAWGPGVPVRPGKQPARTPGPAEVRGTPGVDENGALDQVQGQHRGGSAGLERLWPPVRPGAQAPGPESPTATSALGCLRGPALPPPHLAAPAPRPLCLRAVPRPRPPHLPPPPHPWSAPGPSGRWKSPWC